MSDGYNLDTLDPTRAARRASAVAAACEILGRAGSRRKVLIWVAQTMGVSVEDPHGSRAAQRRALAAALANDVTVYILDPRGNTGGAEDPDSRRTGGALRLGGSSMALEVDDMVAVPLTQITRETEIRDRLPASLVSGALPVVARGGLTALGFEQITALSSSAALTVPSGATVAVVQADVADVRWRPDGATNAPTASVGMLLPSGAERVFDGWLASVRFIQVTAGAVINVSYYQ